MRKSFRSTPSRLRVFLILIGLFPVFSLSAAASSTVHPCAADALQRAEKLLALQTDADERGAISKKLVVLRPLRNPANAKQKFDVLGVTGFVYKAEFRMRFIYAQIPGQCVLVGQEILEYTGL